MKQIAKCSAAFLLFVLLITGLFAGPWQLAAQASTAYNARVTVSKAAVHTGPGGRYHTVVKLSRNASVRVIGTSGHWKKISYGGKTRYIYASYIKKTSPSYSFRSYTAYVKSYSLVMRSKASSHYKKIRTLYMNYKVTVVGAKSGYNYVQYGNSKGYVQAKYLKSKVTSYTAYVVPGSINLWKGPGAKYGRVAYLHQNNIVTVTGSSSGYLKVNYNGTKGYAWGGYFKNGTPPQAQATPAPAQAAPAPVQTSPIQQLDYTPVNSYTAYMGYDNINVYQNPDANSTVVATLRERTAVSVIGTNGNWVKIQFKDNQGNDKSGFVDNTPNPNHNNETNLITDFSKFNPPAGTNGIDISDNNGSINFSALQNNYSFVVIKATEGETQKQVLDNHTNGETADKQWTDTTFSTNAKSATDYKLKVFAYHFFRANTQADASIEANNFADALDSAKAKGANLSYVFVDVETTNGIQGTDSQIKSSLSSNINTFLNVMRTRGYTKLGIYSGLNFFGNYIDTNVIEQPQGPKLLIWIARYRGQDTNLGVGAANVDIWQYTSNGTVGGINGAVDLDVSYYDPNAM